MTICQCPQCGGYRTRPYRARGVWWVACALCGIVEWKARVKC